MKASITASHSYVLLYMGMAMMMMMLLLFFFFFNKLRGMRSARCIDVTLLLLAADKGWDVRLLVLYQ